MSEELPPLPDDVLDLLSAERGAPPVGVPVAARIFGRLELSIGAGLPVDVPDGGAAPPAAPAPAAPPSAPPPAVAPPVPSGTLGALAKGLGVKGAIAVAFAGGAAVGGTTVSLLQDPPAERVVIVHEPAPKALVVETASTTAQPEPPRPTPSPKPRREGPPPVDERERMLLERARVALGRGETAEAIAALESHDRAYRETGLAEEREALWIIALHRGGRDKEARARYEQLRRRYPRSLFLPPARAELGL